MGLFDKLDNLKNLSRLDELQNMKQLEQLNKLDKLDNLQQLQHLEKLDSLNQLQQMQSLDGLNQLNQMQHLQELGKLQYLDKMANMQALNQLQNLNLLKNMKHLEQLHHLDQLQQLKILQRLEKLEYLTQLQKLQELRGLDKLNNLHQLSYTSNLADLGNLNKLHELLPLNRLGAIERAWDFNYTSLLYLSSVIVPGLIFQEAVTIFLKERLGVKRSVVLMAIYNVLTLFVCINFVYNRLTLVLLAKNPIYYYSTWFCVLLLLPLVLGWLLAFLMNRSALGVSFKNALIRQPVLTVANAWGRFLSEAESYYIVITLKNNKRIKGTFSKGKSMPETSHPNDLYVTETSYCEPSSTEWKALEEPIGIWVKGTEIKMVEVTLPT